MKSFKNTEIILPALVIAVLGLCTGLSCSGELPSAPPGKPVKLIFIHHSCGENWLNDENGELAKALGKNNYFVSDTNYGWGPDSIGDRTDIVNWPEWFTGSESKKHLQALLQENRKHSPYKQLVADPGGKNRIIMFKSCFPNSSLGGNPDDPPKRGEDLTVGNAKAIYNDLLKSFAENPGLLFIAVTAPPVQDKSHSRNARAFNNWLVHDWLKEYKDSNVAVFDFYNVLTNPKNHHRYHEGKIEHVIREKQDTLHYDSDGDNHPSVEGNRKATKEFVPLLNIFYNRWRKNASPKASVEEKTSAEKENETANPQNVDAKTLIDGFEDGCDKWTIFSDQAASTRITRSADKDKKFKGKSSMSIEYDVADENWGTCSLVYDSPKSWKGKSGVSFYVYTEKPKNGFTFIVYQGTRPDDLHHFETWIKIPAGKAGKWHRVDVSLDRLRRPSWEGRPEDRLDPTRIQGTALAFTGKGRIWVDQVTLFSGQENANH